jgi:hypothetical protein
MVVSRGAEGEMTVGQVLSHGCNFQIAKMFPRSPRHFFALQPFARASSIELSR